MFASARIVTILATIPNVPAARGRDAGQSALLSGPLRQDRESNCVVIRKSLVLSARSFAMESVLELRNGPNSREQSEEEGLFKVLWRVTGEWRAGEFAGSVIYSNSFLSRKSRLILLIAISTLRFVSGLA